VPVLILELNDAGIQAGGETGTGAAAPFRASPGIAIIDGHTVMTGTAASERARLLPKRVYHRFWSELDTRPLARPFPSDLSNADLAHAHLSGIWESIGTGATSVILAVPGTFTAEQLGLILGIARAAGIPVRGLIDAAVAAASTASTAAGRLLHLDLQLHRIVLTEMSGGAEVMRGAVRVSDHTGRLALEAAWARRIAAIFVRRTRFDPLHIAATEQELYLRLPEFLARLRIGEQADLELGDPGSGRRVEIRRHEIEAAVEADLEGIVHLARSQTRHGESTAILMSHRVAAIPGLAERLADIDGAERIELPAAASISAVLRDPKSILSPGEELPFVLRLAAAATESSRLDGEAGRVTRPATLSSPGATLPPTHLLHAGTAHPITPEPLVLGTAVPEGARGLELAGATSGISRAHCRLFRDGDRIVIEDLSAHGSFLNGRRIDGRTEIAAGDRLRLGSPGIELQLIRMVDPDGASQD
jgi:hypothetical protein